MNLKDAHSLAQRRKAAAVGVPCDDRTIGEGGAIGKVHDAVTADEHTDVLRRMFVGLDVGVDEIETACRIYTRSLIERVNDDEDVSSAIFDTVSTCLLVGRLAAEPGGAS